MKLPILLASLCAAACAAEQTQPLLPLPDFHESWSDGEKDIVRSFVKSLEKTLAESSYSDTDDESMKRYMAFRAALHRAIATGKVEPSFGGDTLARWAAMNDSHEAVKVFIGIGEDPHARYYIEELDLESGLVQEVIFAKGLTYPTHLCNRVALLNWLKDKGWDPAKDAELIGHAIVVALMAENQDMSELLDWFYAQGLELTQERKDLLHQSIIAAQGGLSTLKFLVEHGDIKLNEPINDLLPLQIVCSWHIMDKAINLDNLEYLLQAGADPNLILGYDEEADDGEYNQEGYEEDDLPRDDMKGFSTPIEIVFDDYRFHEECDATDKVACKKALHFQAAVDLLLMYGAELDIEEDEHDDEAVESPVYEEVRKRLNMSHEELEADYSRIRELLKSGNY